MKNVYERKLNHTEGKRHFIYVAAVAWEMFPKSGKPFTLNIGEKKYKAKLDGQNRIWTSDFRDFIDLSIGNTVVLKKNSDNSFSLSLKK